MKSILISFCVLASGLASVEPAIIIPIRAAVVYSDGAGSLYFTMPNGHLYQIKEYEHSNGCGCTPYD